jgi:radical SAM superfamily enzyme
MPKKPFVEPAWEDTKDEVLGSIDKELEKVVTSYWKRTVKR